jgi:hypothetical protein
MATFDSGSITLPQYAMESNDPVVRKFVKAILSPESILNDIKLKTNKRLSAKGLRALPEDLGTFTGWTDVNETPNIYNASLQDFEERCFMIRNLLVIDEALLEQEDWIQDPISARISLWRELLQYELNTTFFYNHPATGNPKAWVGMNARYTLPQYKVPARNIIDCSDIDLSGTITTANANKLLERLGFAFAFTGAPGGVDACIYTNYLAKEKMATAIRSLGNSGGWRYDKDAFDREIEKFRSAVVRDVGFRQDSETPVISFSENAAGEVVAADAGDRTTLHVVHWGDNFMSGWQRKALKPKSLGLDPTNGVKHNFLVDWGVGLYQAHPRAICKLVGIKVR